MMGLGLLFNRDTETKWLAVPFYSKLNRWCVNGNAEVLNLLKRQRFSEMMETDLEARKLKKSQLPTRFHILQLVGLGQAKRFVFEVNLNCNLCRVSTTSGFLIKL